MILWGRPSSVNVQKVLWALDELGLQAEHRVVGGKYGGLDRAEFRAISPLPRVPVLEDGETVVWESHAILRYLARRESSLGASDISTDIWMEYGSTTVQPPFIALFWQRLRTRPADRDPVKENLHLAALASALRAVDGQLSNGRPYMTGDAFTLADIALGAMTHRIRELMPEALNDAPNLPEWIDRLAQRPAYARHVATSFEELRVTG